MSIKVLPLVALNPNLVCEAYFGSSTRMTCNIPCYTCKLACRHAFAAWRIELQPHAVKSRDTAMFFAFGTYRSGRLSRGRFVCCADGLLHGLMGVA